MMSKLDITKIKGFFAGSGSDAFADSSVVDRLLSLTGSFDATRGVLTSPVRVVYIGTATYDLPGPRATQLRHFLSRGCAVTDLRLADLSQRSPAPAELRGLEAADVVLVSGGNTLFAVRRWEEAGLVACLRAAAGRGAVLAGGSAGAICWFTAGHSDSADPATYAEAMRRAAEGGEGAVETPEKGEGEAKWSYIRVHGTDLLPGLLCPHHDKRQSNGVLREEDFDKMLRRHPTERGIAIDHWAALVLLGDGSFEVFATPGKSCQSGDGGAPHVYTKDIVDGKLCVTSLERSGRVEDLLRWPTGPIVRDPFENYFAMHNPTASTDKMVRPPG